MRPLNSISPVPTNSTPLDKRPSNVYSISIRDTINDVYLLRSVSRESVYELIILCLLMRSPLHGYLILKIANDQIGPWAKISSGSLYQILAKLEQAGIITVMNNESLHSPGERVARQLRVFTITDEGRERFRQVMMDT